MLCEPAYCNKSAAVSGELYSDAAVLFLQEDSGTIFRVTMINYRRSIADRQSSCDKALAAGEKGKKR